MMQSLNDSIEKYDSGYYAEQLEIGLQFQDYLTRKLYHHGIVIVGHASKKYQIKYGENMLGAEIKRDSKFRQTGNIYIETAEKSDPRKQQYVQSGVMRDDNSWLFVIGDEQTVWIFDLKILRILLQRKRPDGKDLYVERTTPTSIGRLIPMSHADRYARRIDFQ